MAIIAIADRTWTKLEQEHTDLCEKIDAYAQKTVDEVVILEKTMAKILFTYFL